MYLQIDGIKGELQPMWAAKTKTATKYLGRNQCAGQILRIDRVLEMRGITKDNVAGLCSLGTDKVNVK